MFFCVAQSAAVVGEVYRLRAPCRLREGLAELEEDGSTGHQFVSTTISAVSRLVQKLET